MSTVKAKRTVSVKLILEILIPTLIFAALAAVSAIWDLQINKALYNPQSFFGQYFANLGEIPTYAAVPFIGAVFFHQPYSGVKKPLKVFFKVLSALLIFIAYIVIIGFWVWENFMKDIDYAIVYKIIFSLTFTLLTIWGTSKVSKKTMKKLLILAIFLAVVAALSNIIVQVMKFLWARQRFRTMVDIPQNQELLAIYGRNFEGFSPWYKPHFIFGSAGRTKEYIRVFEELDGSAFKSFPSGHTVAASAFFGVVILPEMFKKLKKFSLLFWIVPAIYTAMVGISRIVVGAHYLSDVLFGGYIGFIVAAGSLAVFKLLAKKGKIKPLDYVCSEFQENAAV